MDDFEQNISLNSPPSDRFENIDSISLDANKQRWYYGDDQNEMSEMRSEKIIDDTIIDRRDFDSD